MTKTKRLIQWLEGERGRPYQWGAKGPDEWDCSGLVWGAFKSVGILLPHGSANQARFARRIAVARAHEGCLIFKTRSTGVVYHVGIVVAPAALIEARGRKWGVVRRAFWRDEWNLAGKIDSLYA